MPCSIDSAVATPWLSRFVEDVRVIVPVPGRALLTERLPDGRTILALRVFDSAGPEGVCLMGPRTRAMFKTSHGVARVVLLRFKPGWSSPLLGIPASALTDDFVPLEDIFGPSSRALDLELAAAQSVSDVVESVSRAIAIHIDPAFEVASARLARRAVRLIEAGEFRIETVAQRLGVTSRHLRRAFTENVGIGPKDFARSVRLQRAVRLSKTSSDWGRIAAAAGYYDQAHLIGDFRELVGLTPGAFVRRAGKALD